MKYGIIEEHIPELRSYDFETICGTITEKDYPEEYEIPRQNTGVLKNQRDISACVACVGTQIAEAIKKINTIIDQLISKGYSNEDIEKLTDDEINEFLESIYDDELSEGFFYGTLRSDSIKTPGMIVSDALNNWKNLGPVPKSYYDILLEMPEQQDSIKKIPELLDIAKQYKIGGYTRITYADKTKRDLAIKQALTNNPRIKQFPLLAAANKGFSENHCILLTGWNDKTKKYKFKNSWGEKYGDKGFSEISKDYINDIYVIIPEELKLPFEDVHENDWFFKEIKHMFFNGFAKGITETKFEPNKTPTRAEMFVSEYRILKMIDERFKIINKVINEKLN